MSDEIAICFTFKTIEDIRTAGGSAAWKISPKHARLCRFVICARNAKDPRALGRSKEAHHAGFLVGRVSDVVQAPNRQPGRLLFQFSEYALVDIPDMWKGDRFPVRYITTDDVSIDFAGLDWQPMPASDEAPEPIVAPGDEMEDGGDQADAPLTLAQAKRGLAMTFGVLPEAIEITVRG